VRIVARGASSVDVSAEVRGFPFIIARMAARAELRFGLCEEVLLCAGVRGMADCTIIRDGRMHGLRFEPLGEVGVAGGAQR
jgi:hypothetical protein